MVLSTYKYMLVVWVLMHILVLFEREALKTLCKMVKLSKSGKLEACNSEDLDMQLRSYKLHFIRF